MESVRKDIECCFGIIKGWWRLFKGGILFNTREKIDNAWFTACILHNMLHKVKRLDEMEEDADWVGSAGEPFTNAEVSMAMDGYGDGWLWRRRGTRLRSVSRKACSPLQVCVGQKAGLMV